MIEDVLVGDRVTRRSTRLTDNLRFAVVLEDYPASESRFEPGVELDAASDESPRFDDDPKPTLELSTVLFPSEYASLRDRPTMRESLELLHEAQDHSSSAEGESR